MLHTNGKATKLKADHITQFYNRIVALLGDDILEENN